MSDRERVLALVNLHGWNATAFQTLESGYRYYFHGDDACVAYVDTGGAYVAAGAPIAATEMLVEVALAFVREAESAGRRACFFATEERMIAAAGEALKSTRIGEQPVWDPGDWAAILKQKKSLREQLRRARAKGVIVRRVATEELEVGPVREGMNQVIERWLSTRGMAPMEFLVRVDPFTFPAHRRCFVAERDGALIGFAAVVPVPKRGGWFLEDLLRDPSAPSGTAELMVDAVMRWADENGSEWLTLGLAPLAGEVPAPLKLARKTSALLYDFAGLATFKAKLQPSAWAPIFISYPPSQSAVVSMFDAVVAFTRGGLVRFGARSLVRGPTAVIRALAVALVPWTALLALAPVDPWFPSGAVKWGWVAFDVAVAGGLFYFLRRPRMGLVTALSIAVTTDAALTLLEAALWNLPRIQSVFEAMLVGIACAGPILAALVLWGARGSLRLATRAG